MSHGLPAPTLGDVRWNTHQYDAVIRKGCPACPVLHVQKRFAHVSRAGIDVQLNVALERDSRILLQVIQPGNGRLQQERSDFVALVPVKADRRL